MEVLQFSHIIQLINENPKKSIESLINLQFLYFKDDIMLNIDVHCYNDNEHACRLTVSEDLLLNAEVLDIFILMLS